MPIRTKLLLVFIVLSLGPPALVGFLAYESGRHTIEAALGALFRLRAVRAIETLDRETEALRSSVQTWARLELMQDVLTNDPDGRVSAFLMQQARSDQTIALALVADPEGTVVATSRLEWLGRALTTLAPAGLAGRVCLDEPLGEDPGDSPFLTCAVPIRAAFDEERGIGRLYVMFDLAPSIAHLQAAGAKAPEPVEMVFMRGEGSMIAPAGDGDAPSPGAWAVELAAQGGTGHVVERMGGRDHLVGYAHSSGITGWSVLVGQDTRVAFAPVYRIRLVVIGLATALTVLVVVLSFAMARRLTSPILELTHAAQQVASGDLEPSLPRRSLDEIGDLIRGFAHMVEELRAQRLKLVEKDYVDSIVSHMVDGLIVVDSEGQVLTANPALHHLSGRRAEDLVGRPAGALFAEGEEAFRERVLEPVRRQRAVRSVELRLLGEADRTVPVSLSAGSLPPGPGGTGAVVCILTDITPMKDAEAALVRAREEAEAGARAKARFLATMSHEIRTPLNGIIGMMELLVDSRLEPKQRDYAETAQHSGEALLAIVGDILDYSKLEAGGLELESLEFDLCAALEGVADTLAPRARERALELAVVCEPDLPKRVRGDERRLRQILLNLGSNAVKFTPRGHVLLRARSDPDRRSGVRIEVADTGIGIPRERHERLFRPFSQVDASTTRKYGGTGLGLAISSQLVEMMGGEIGVDTEEGRGSTFWISVPLPAVGETREAGAVKLAGLCVLVVDDNETNRDVVCEMLERWGCRATSASDGWEALQVLRGTAARRGDFDLALVDYQMPEMDGAQLAAEIRKDARFANLPLVLLTSIPQHAETARQMGFEACLAKPIKGDALRQAIVAAVGPPEESAPEPSPTPPPPGSRGRVLVVDDDPTSRKVATELLEKLGCHCQSVASGEAALDVTGRETYDLVFMDCQMPEMDGYETTRRIRSRSGRQSSVAIVAMTGDAFGEDRTRCLDAGMNDHLAKPVRTATLERVLDRYLPSRA